MITSFGPRDGARNGDFISVDTATLNVTGGGLALEMPDGTIIDKWATGQRRTLSATAWQSRRLPRVTASAVTRMELQSGDDGDDFIDYAGPSPGATNP